MPLLKVKKLRLTLINLPKVSYLGDNVYFIGLM